MNTSAARATSESLALRIYLSVVYGAGALTLAGSTVEAFHAPLPLGWLALAALAMATSSLRRNIAPVAANIAVGLDTGQPAFDIWRRHFQWLSINYFAAASVAFCIILLIQQASLMAAIVVLPLLAIFHLTLRASFGRVEDAHRHLAAVDRLYLSTVQTLAMAIDAKD